MAIVTIPVWVSPGGYVELTFSDDGSTLTGARTFVPDGYGGRLMLVTSNGDYSRRVADGFITIDITPSPVNTETRVGLDVARVLGGGV